MQRNILKADLSNSVMLTLHFLKKIVAKVLSLQLKYSDSSRCWWEFDFFELVTQRQQIQQFAASFHEFHIVALN